MYIYNINTVVLITIIDLGPNKLEIAIHSPENNIIISN